MSKLEKDFKKVAKEINAKIKEAAQAMKEVNNLAANIGIKRLIINEYDYDYDEFDKDEVVKIEKFSELIDIYPLFNKLDEAGWRTSSIGC